MKVEGSFVEGDYTKFWGSLDWEIKIDFDFQKLDDFSISFKNQTQLENTFQVSELCSLAHLFIRTMELDEKFGDKLAITRLSNFLAEYLGKYLAPVYPKQIEDCLKDRQDKVQVKVKKMTTTDFYNKLDFDEKDLSIDFKSFYDQQKEISHELPFERVLESEAENLTRQDTFTVQTNFTTFGEQIESEITEKILKTDQKNVFLGEYTLYNDQEHDFEEIACYITVPLAIRLKDVRAKIFAPDNSELGIFQPVNISLAENESNILVEWRIDKLKPMHSILFSHTIKKRVFHFVNYQGSTTTILYDDINTESDSIRFVIPNISNFHNKESINSISTILPLEMNVDENSPYSKLIDSTNLSTNNRVINWKNEVLKLSENQEIIVEYLEPEQVLKELLGKTQTEMDEDLTVDLPEPEIIENEHDTVNNLELETELQNKAVTVEEVVLKSERTKTRSKKKKISEPTTFKEPQELEKNEDLIVLYNQNGILNSIVTIHDLDLRLRIKVPEGERFTAVLLNPFEMVSAHIEGGYIKGTLFRKFKLPLNYIEGVWILKIQYLEKDIGITKQYRIHVEI